ncbi:putative 60S ribosomal protein L18-2 [Paratrimastix pyriformis]|uniref:60S ribosomal protein L18-2 n=1 Tax=Paratrimastix pyriformis TaxID=342808 RepID=A0ABQ8UIS3_9EUKA|nr:putative 60S ribosomal protein L18-2 [Paratrimastix pyriformis]
MSVACIEIKMYVKLSQNRRKKLLEWKVDNVYVEHICEPNGGEQQQCFWAPSLQSFVGRVSSTLPIVPSLSRHFHTSTMGIDLRAGGRIKPSHRTEPASKNIYLRLITKLYRFLARRTDAAFNEAVLRRLFLSKIHRAPMSVARVARYMKGKESKVAVLCGTVTDDVRIHELPKMKICALRFTDGARARIIQAGGECITFDQLALRKPTGADTVLLRGPTSAREAERHFGPAPGARGSHTKPYVRTKGRKFEKGRGRRFLHLKTIKLDFSDGRHRHIWFWGHDFQVPQKTSCYKLTCFRQTAREN